MYEAIKLRVKCFNSLSDLYTRDVGLLQGGIMSPFLFSFFLADIEAHLQENIRPKKKIPVFLLTRPTLAQAPDSAVFIATGKNKNYNALPYQIFHPTLIIFRFASFCYQKVCLSIFRS